MSDVDEIDVLRERAVEFARKHEGNGRWADEISPLLDRLRVRLAETERLAEEWQRRAEMVWRQRDAADRRAEAAESRLAEVEAERDAWAKAAGGLKDAEANTRARLAEVEAQYDAAMFVASKHNLRAAEAEARLREVEARCDAAFEEGDIDWWDHVERIRAVARGEGDRG